MKIINIYETYKEVNGRYDQLLEGLSGQEEIIQNQEVREKLAIFKQEFEGLMNEASSIEIDADNEENMRDLKYLLVDSYFLSLDISHFYEVNEMGRLKLRVLNYLNKKRRSEIFG